MTLCSKCKENIENKQRLTCRICKNTLHLLCSHVSEKLFYLMSPSRKTKWMCMDCKSRNNSSDNEGGNYCSAEEMHSTPHITHRKKHRINLPLQNSFEGLTTDDDDCSPNQLDRSCPNIYVKNGDEDIEKMKKTIIEMQEKLTMADNVIENHLAENFTLKKQVLKYELKIKQLTQISNERITSHRSSNRRSSDNTNEWSKLDKVKCNLNNSNNQEDLHKGKKMTNECIQPDDSTETLADLKLKIEKLLGELRTARQEIEYLLIEIAKLKTINEGSDNIEQNSYSSMFNRNKTIEKNKICLLSTNKRNNLLSIAETTLGHDFELCHYLIPNCNTDHLITDIQLKLTDFTMKDFCVILIGEEDFNVTKDYYEQILHIKGTLQQIDYTNVVLCLPTFRCRKFTDMFNSRVEHFNNLIYMDNTTHEYAYILDSNLNLKYDHTMFHRQTGTVNDAGMQVIVNDLNILLKKITFWNFPESDTSQEIQENNLTTDTDQNGITPVQPFFRE